MCTYTKNERERPPIYRRRLYRGSHLEAPIFLMDTRLQTHEGQVRVQIQQQRHATNDNFTASATAPRSPQSLETVQRN